MTICTNCQILFSGIITLSSIELAQKLAWVKLQTGPICLKLNTVVSLRDIKISVLKYGEYIDFFFCWKKKNK